MNPHPSAPALPLALLLAATAAGAADITLEPRPFTVVSEFSCVAVPVEAEPIGLDADRWSDFTIESILDHGTAVKAGDKLITFQSATLERALVDQRRQLETAKLALADARSALAAAEAELPLKLAAARASYQRATEDLERFTKVTRPAREEQARQDLDRSEFRLKSALEELNQLKAMYEADDLTEETEEFILERQQKSVEAAQFSLRLQKLETEQTLKVDLPRQAEDLQRGIKQARITLDRAEAELPRTVEQARLAAQAAASAHQRTAADLAELEADAKKLTLTAPIAGRFFYGVFRDGKWVTGDLLKGLVKGGKVGTVLPFATVVPDGAALRFMARADQKAVRGVSLGDAAKLRLAGYDEQPLDAKVSSVDAVPGTDGLFLVGLDATLPEGLAANPGAKASAKVEVHTNPQAIVVPKAALKDGNGGSRQVEVRLADGQTELREVRIGRSSDDGVEILAGVEAGQAIVVPEAAKE
jgi:hypothetical protein